MFHFFIPKDNAISVTKQLLRGLKVKVTNSTLQETLREHPDYPSLLSIMDSLERWKIENIGIQAKTEQLSNFPTPFIAHIRENKQDVFTVVQEIDNDQITYYSHEQQKFVTASLFQFSNIFNGTVTLTSSQREEGSGEPEYKKKRWQEQFKNSRILVALLLAILLITSVFTNVFTKIGSEALFSILFTLLSFAGVILTSILLWYEVDQQNPVLGKMCTAGKHTNCSAIIHSKAAKLGGLISWGEIGFMYFTGGFLSLLLSGMNTSIMTLLAWLNVLAIPYIFFSIYYQWRIAKRWCVLCLGVQALLLAELLICLSGNLYASPLQASLTQWIVLLVFSFLTPILVWSAIKPLWIQSREGKRNKTALLRLKHDPRIFGALLPKQKRISPESIQHMGITLGDPGARHKLVKICNPYCMPCANAHTRIGEILISRPEISAQIIFTATDDENDKSSKPVKHLMALYEKGNEIITKQALDDWYNAKEKDYSFFAKKYPLNGELQQQGKKLKAMSDWCKERGISSTPTFFIDGYQMPEIYRLEDLKYLLG